MVFYIIAKVAIVAIIDDGKFWEQSPAEQQHLKQHYQDLRRELFGTEDV